MRNWPRRFFALRFQLFLKPIEAAVPALAVRLALISSGESFVRQNHFRKDSARLKFHRHQRVTSLVDGRPDLLVQEK